MSCTYTNFSIKFDESIENLKGVVDFFYDYFFSNDERDEKYDDDIEGEYEEEHEINYDDYYDCNHDFNLSIVNDRINISGLYGETMDDFDSDQIYFFACHLAKDKYPDNKFTISGCIDDSECGGEYSDFEIKYDGNKVSCFSSSWYYIYHLSEIDYYVYNKTGDPEEIFKSFCDEKIKQTADPTALERLHDLYIEYKKLKNSTYKDDKSFYVYSRNDELTFEIELVEVH